MRLFVGIDLPEEAKETLHRLTLQLKRSSHAGSFVRQENLHLTLAFIGETRRIDETIIALEQAAHEYRVLCSEQNDAVYCDNNSADDAGFELDISGVGSFRQRRGHTWWVGIDAGQDRVIDQAQDQAQAQGPGVHEGLNNLKALQKTIIAALRNAGFELEKRSYKPHITLARSVQTKGLVSLEPPPLVIPVQEFCLFNSRHMGGQQEYTILKSFALAPPTVAHKFEKLAENAL